MRTRHALIATVAVACLAPAALAANSFTDLGPGGAVDVSKDGTLVTGTDAANGYIWTTGTGKVTIGNAVVGVDWLSGGVLVAGNVGGVASVWQGTTAGVGVWAPLPDSDKGTWQANALGVQADSSNYWVVGKTPGSSNHSAIRYQLSTASSTSMPLPPSGHDRSTLLGASDTGVLTGWAQYQGSGATGGARTGFRSSPDATNAWLGSPAGLSSQNESQSLAISGDGNVKAGWGYGSPNPNNWVATWWGADDAVHSIPQFPGQDWAEAHALNGDGSLIGGFTYLAPAYSTKKAWVYSAATDSVAWVSDFLTQAGLNVSGWEFTNVTGISWDGRTLVGTGTYAGAAHGWVARIPEPTSLLLLAAGSLMLGSRRKRS